MEQNKFDVIVIGAGFGGLSSAAFLAKSGKKVLILEKNNQAGGRAIRYEEKGFVFDMGPSWYMIPEIYDEFFRKLGFDRKDFYQIEKLEPSYKLWFEDGDEWDVSTDKKWLKETFEKYEPGSFERLEWFLEDAKRKLDMSLEKFLYKNFSKLTDLVDFKLAKEAIDNNYLSNWQSLLDKNFKHPKLKQLLAWPSVFVGGSPQNTPSVYSLLGYADLGIGIYYPEEGFSSLVKACEKVCRKLGIEFEFDSAVSKINPTKDGCEVFVGNTKYECSQVVVNADYRYAEEQLLDKTFQSYNRKYWDSRTYSPHALCYYLGVNKKLPNLKHHNYYFTEYEKLNKQLSNIFHNPKWDKNPSFYVCAPSKTDNKVAPPNSENLFILVPAAISLEDNGEVEEIFDFAISKIEERIGEKFKDNIVHKRVIAQKAHQELYNAHGGNSFGLAHTLFQTAMFRPSIKAKKAPNVYYTGHYTQPGTSTSICLISGELAAKEVLKS